MSATYFQFLAKAALSPLSLFLCLSLPPPTPSLSLTSPLHKFYVQINLGNCKLHPLEDSEWHWYTEDSN